MICSTLIPLNAAGTTNESAAGGGRFPVLCIQLVLFVPCFVVVLPCHVQKDRLAIHCVRGIFSRPAAIFCSHTIQPCEASEAR